MPIISGVAIDEYEKLIVLDFIYWVYSVKNVDEIEKKNEKEIKSYLFEFLSTTDHKHINELYVKHLKKIFYHSGTIRNIKEFLGLKSKESIQKLYQKFISVEFSSILLFSYHDRHKKREFLDKYKVDVNALTADHLNFFYSTQDTKKKSGYQIINLIDKKSITNLPAILIWNTKEGIHTAIGYSLKSLNIHEIFKLFEKIVFEIKAKNFHAIIREWGKRHRVDQTTFKNSTKRDIEKLKAEIGINKIGVVINKLENIVFQFYPNKLNNFIQIKNSYIRITEKKRLGLEKPSYIFILENNLNKSLLGFLDGLIEI